MKVSTESLQLEMGMRTLLCEHSRTKQECPTCPCICPTDFGTLALSNLYVYTA